MLGSKQSVKSDPDQNPDPKKIISDSQHCRKQESFSKEQKRITGIVPFMFPCS
jgi:hypothetical protein